MNKKLLLPLAAVCLLAGACAKNEVSTTGQNAKKYIQLWMDKYHPGISANENGLYILEDTPGTGFEWTGASQYIYARSTITTLSGTISSTTEEKLAQQLGTYVKGNYYGPRYQIVGEGYSYAGMDAMLEGMRLGGTRKAVIPAWMLTTSRYLTQEEYIKNCSTSTHLIYEITLVSMTDDPEETQTSLLANYVTEHYGNVASVSYITDTDPDGTFWFISDVSGFKEEDALSTNANVNVNYTGKLLDGTVFDTTLEKVAKDAGIYSADREYAPQSVTLSETYSDITMGSSSSLISGFQGGLSLMHWKGQKAVVLFASKHGYSSSGSGNTIPAYAPLIFELEILE